MTPDPVVDERRAESLFQEVRRYAPHYTPDMTLSDEQGAGVALMRIFAQLAESVVVRLGRTPHKNFVAFLDKLGISLLPARPARVPVTFKLVAGFDQAVQVPAGVRVTAPGAEDDIPFETTADLVAVPGAVAAMYGVDPLADRVFRPPPGFLAQEIKEPTELVYEVLSFAAAGSDRLQLTHVAELAPGAVVKLGCRDLAVVSVVDDGNIVRLEKPLAEDVAPGTIVTPVRTFSVFEGIDLQEHALYIGGADLFTIKAEAEITVGIELAGTETEPLQPFAVIWQFWTKDEGAADSEEHWHDLVELSDGTAGLSSSGDLVLRKPDALEIKETEVGGTSNRWIRAQLVEKLPVGGKALPDIDTIVISVASPQKNGPNGAPAGIPADQAFHNVTPITADVAPSIGFFPFGTEPRQFDQFYLASAEAFSKRNATVTLQFELDLQTLATPVLVQTNLGLRAYSIGLRRRLYELDLEGGGWNILGSPFDVPDLERYYPVEDAIPAAVVTAAGDLVCVFVTTENALDEDPANKANKLSMHSHPSNAATGKWTDLDAPTPATGKKQIKFGPGAIVLPAGSPAFAQVFVVGGDGQLYSRQISDVPTPLPDWQRHDAPAGEPWVSAPFVTVAAGAVVVFISGSDGIVHRLDVASNGWTQLTPSNQAFAALSRPFAQPFTGTTDAKVFVLGRETGSDRWTLFECDTSLEAAGEFPWEDLGAPGTTQDFREEPGAHDPCGFVERPDAGIGTEGKHIFLCGADNRLYERLDGEISAGVPRWEDRTRAGDPSMRDSPGVHAGPPVEVDGVTTTRLRVASASSRNSLVTWVFEIHSAVPADPAGLAVLLDEDASAVDDEHAGAQLHITSGNASGASHTIDAYDGTRKVARLATVLLVLPDDTFDYDIGGAHDGTGQAGTERLLALHDPIGDGRPAQPLALRVDDDFVDIDFYSRLTGVVLLSQDPPAFPITYALYLKLGGEQSEFLSIDVTVVPELSWEYWNGRGWLSLAVTDGTRNLLTDGAVTFAIPASLQPTEVAGQENFWIRARLVGGDYGRETFKVIENPPGQSTVVSEKSNLRPPKVRALTITYKAPPVPPGASLTFNNLEYVDQTAAATSPGAHFPPFERLEDRTPTLFVGFDVSFSTGPVRLLVDAAEREVDRNDPPELVWTFRKDRRWKPLDATDETIALTRQALLTISPSAPLTRESRFGEPLFWTKGSLQEGRGASAVYPLPLLRAIFLNTVWASQGETITDEIVGSSDGEPDQSFTLQHADVLENEDIRVQEPLSAEEREAVERERGPDGVIVRDDIGGPWVRWRETLAFFDAGPQDRCYAVDRASGVIRFGNGTHGRIPPAGVDNIRAFRYRTGGGAAGNVPPGAVEGLATAVTGVESVFNPTAAGGGSDTADTAAMLTIGPRRISHRDRAVSPEDFEELAYEASRQVAKARCLPITNLARSGAGRLDPCDPAQRHEALAASGWVSLIIVPQSSEPQPCPTLELRRAVADYLQRRAPVSVTAGERLVIRPPDYVVIGVEAVIFVTSLDKAAAAERGARAALDEFLHPLRGGPEGTGWEFGRPVSASDIFTLLERIPEVDRVEDLMFLVRGGRLTDRVDIGVNELVASGSHTLEIRKA